MSSYFPRFLLAFLVSIGLLVTGPRSARAHATLIKSEPSAGSVLTSAPASIWLQFNEEMQPKLAKLILVRSDGSVIILASAGDPHDVNAVIAPLDSLSAGAYQVKWRVVSADGHPVEGILQFSVNAPAPLPIPESSERVEEEEEVMWGPHAAGAPLIPSALRGIGLTALMGFAGLLLFLSWSGRGGVPHHQRASRLAMLLAFIAPVLLALHAAAWLMNASPDHQIDMDIAVAMAGSFTGKLEAWRVGMAILALWAFALARRTRIALVFALASLIVSGASGHSAAISPAFAVPAKAIHLVASAAWLGGLLWLLTFDRTNRTQFVSETKRVSAVALTSVVIVTLSGTAQTFLFLPALSNLFTSAYGYVVLAKIAGLAVLLAFGAHHRNRVLPILGDDVLVPERFARTLRTEVFVMLAVMLIGAFLAYVPTPSEPVAASTLQHAPS